MRYGTVVHKNDTNYIVNDNFITLTDFHNFCTAGKRTTFLTKLLQYIPFHFITGACVVQKLPVLSVVPLVVVLAAGEWQESMLVKLVLSCSYTV